MESNKTSQEQKPKVGSIKNKIVAQDLEEERKKANFDIKELTESYFGGKEKLEQHNDHISVMENDPILRNTEKWYDMTREEQIEHNFKRARRTYEINKEKYYHNYEVSYIPWFSAMFQGIVSDWPLQINLQNLQFPFGLTMSMFSLCIQQLGDDEQVAKWLPLVKQMKMIGCYAQTELGHGSNVAVILEQVQYFQGLETTATFDKEKDEFILNSPTITSTKFWPGELGKFGGWAVVYAKMIINGKNHGVQPFMLQMRDTETYETLPGIECGDIGPKFGYASKDNGYLILKNVRIPRSNLLQRYVNVDREGHFTIKGDLRSLYSVMMFIRVSIAIGAAKTLGVALTIGTRYAVVRRQFSTQDGTKIERKLLDYQTHQFKYTPLLAYTYAFNFTSLALMEMHQQLLKDMKTGNFGLLDLAHHLSSGYKASYTRICYDGIDTIRQSCGGAGFLAWSGLPTLQTDYAPNTTFEGDNTVMHQQSARLILKTIKNIQRGFKPTGIFDYFNKFEELLSKKGQVKGSADLLCLVNLENALAVRSAFKIKTTAMKMATSQLSENEKANSAFSVDMVSMAHAHIMYVTFKYFLNHIENHPYKCPKVKENLKNLARVYALTELLQDSVSLYETGFFTVGNAQHLLEAQKEAIAIVRPQMIPLVEALAVPDSYIVSAIGNSYGDIYETQLEWAKNSKLNQTSVLPGIKEHILPILHGKL